MPRAASPSRRCGPYVGMQVHPAQAGQPAMEAPVKVLACRQSARLLPVPIPDTGQDEPHHATRPRQFCALSSPCSIWLLARPVCMRGSQESTTEPGALEHSRTTSRDKHVQINRGKVQLRTSRFKPWASPVPFAGMRSCMAWPGPIISVGRKKASQHPPTPAPPITQLPKLRLALLPPTGHRAAGARSPRAAAAPVAPVA